MTTLHNYAPLRDRHVPRNYDAIRDHRTATALLDRIRDEGRPIGFDIEAGYHGEDKAGAALMQFHPDYFVVGVSFTNDTSWARYVPLAHDNGGNIDDHIPFGRSLWKMLQTGLGVAHNAAYELKGLSRWFRENFWNDPEIGDEVRRLRGMFGLLSDTMLLAWLCAEYHPKTIGKDLKSLADAAVGLKMTHFKDLFPTEDSDLGPTMKRGKIRFQRFNSRNSYHPAVINYACEDSVATLILHELHYPEQKDTLIFKLEMDLIPILVDMESGPIDSDGNFQGNMLFDWTLVHRKSAEAALFADKMREEILVSLSERLGRIVSVNLASPLQLSKLLFDPAPDGLGLPVKERSEKTGVPSTGDKALAAIAKVDPIIRKILQYRRVCKLNSSYLLKFINEMSYSENGYVFPNHNQSGALTGRFSVDQVSYQQWPKPYHFELEDGSTFDLNFRDLFVAPSGFRIVGFDYANVEMRIAGSMSGETKITDAFNAGKDLHKATAADMFHLSDEEVTKVLRQRAKTLNFQILYGGGAQALADSLSVTKAEAQKLLDDYLAGYSRLAAWINHQQAYAHQHHFVSTHFGRKFTVWDFQEKERWKRDKGDRMAVNAPVQGTGADIIKLAMVRVARAIKKAGLDDKVRMTLTVHDALEFLVHDSIPTQQVIDLLEPCVNFAIPGFPVEIRADWHEGYQWGAQAEISIAPPDETGSKKITGYEFTYELPWEGKSFHWSGQSLIEVLDQYYSWEDTHFGVSSPIYRNYRPDWTPDLSTGPVTVDDGPPIKETIVSDDPIGDIVSITLRGVPNSHQVQDLVNFLRSRPGTCTVRLEIPGRPIKTLDQTYDIRTEDQSLLSLMLGGAAISIWSSDVAVEDILLDDDLDADLGETA